MSGRAGAVLVLALPWLNPFAPLPSPAVLPWLVTLACVGVLLLLLGWRRLVTPPVAAGAWLLAALLSSVIALCQYFGVEQHFWPWMNGSPTGEAFANLRQRNQFASLTSIGLLALLWWATRAAPRAGAAWGLAVATLLLAAGNAASASRTGLVQWLLIVALAWWWGAWKNTRVRWALGVAVAGYALATWLLPLLAGMDPLRRGILARFGGDGCGSRLVLWRNVLELIAERPWTGWGWGELDYAHFTHRYDGPRFCEIMGNAHNLPLHLAVELGVPLALLLMMGVGVVIWRQRPWAERDSTGQLAWGVLAVIGVHSLLEYPLWYGPFQLAALLALGLLGAGGAVMPAQAAGPGRMQMAQGALLLAAAFYAGLEYRRISQIYLPLAERASAYREHTLEKIRDSWLFREQVHFAELTLTPVTRENAAAVHALARELLHYSPEARVVEKLIESALLLGREEEARWFLLRYRAAYPKEHARWAADLGLAR